MKYRMCGLPGLVEELQVGVGGARRPHRRAGPVAPSEGGEDIKKYLELVESVDPNLTMEEFWLSPIELDSVKYGGPHDHTNEIIYENY